MRETPKPPQSGALIRGFQVIKRQVKLETMLNSLIERGGYSRNRQAILDSIHVTAAALSQYARGRTRPSFDKLVALADFFGVSLDYLVYGEPTNTSVDPAPIARYVRQALMDVSARTNQHSDLVARIGRLLMDRVNDVAKEVVSSRSAGMEGLIENTEILRVERHCLQANIVSTDLSPNINILDEGDEAVPGQYFPVVVDNLVRGCTYRFLLAGELAVQSPVVSRLREMITDAVGGDTLHEHCFFRTTTLPLASTTVLYNLDTSTFAPAEPALFTQFGKYLLDGTWLGYLNRPNDDSTADMLMAPSYVERAREAFDALWGNATT
jgi:transcriptional regulator with XRE-family HTH domain